MKKVVLLLFALSLVLCLLSSCNGSVQTSSSEAASIEQTDVTEPEEETSAASQPIAEQKGDVEIVYASYSERPYAAVVGRCAEGATVYATSDTDSAKAESWHGWFAIRINCPKRLTVYTFTQEIDGETVGEPTVKKISPLTPSSEMWPIITGYDSQLFFQKMLPDFSHENLPSEKDLSSFRTRIINRLSQLHEVNPDAEIIYMVVPSSMTVYPELVPETYKQGSGSSKLDLTLAAAKEAGATVIDLRDAFAAHKQDEMPLYYKFDSHWTDYGAFVAYTELFTHISERFPAAKPRSLSEFQWKGDSYESGDMIYYLQMKREVVKDYGYLRVMNFADASGASEVSRYVSTNRLTYSDPVTYEHIFRSSDAQKPNLLVLRDSYSTQIYDILAERGNTTHYLGMWNYTWNKSLITSEKPDYVIYLIAEWNIDAILYN